MNNRFLSWAAGAVVLVIAPSTGFASELVYRPVNPSFGGDPLNGNALLSQATAQNTGAGGGTGGFTIDFPDFGSIPQPTPTDPTDLPDVPITTPTTTLGVVGN